MELAAPKALGQGEVRKTGGLKQCRIYSFRHIIVVIKARVCGWMRRQGILSRMFCPAPMNPQRWPDLKRLDANSTKCAESSLRCPIPTPNNAHIDWSLSTSILSNAVWMWTPPAKEAKKTRKKKNSHKMGAPQKKLTENTHKTRVL